jgi:uncharacterized protein (UPF0335 family)
MTRAVAHDQLKAFVERIERMEAEKKAISDDVKEIYAEAKGNGFNIRVLREVVRCRRLNPGEFEEYEAIRDLYFASLGMVTADLFKGDDETAAEVASADASARKKRVRTAKAKRAGKPAAHEPSTGAEVLELYPREPE